MSPPDERKCVLPELCDYRLGRLEVMIVELREITVELQISVARLNVKAGFWGALGGAIPAALTLAYMVLK